MNDTIIVRCLNADRKKNIENPESKRQNENETDEKKRCHLNAGSVPENKKKKKKKKKKNYNGLNGCAVLCLCHRMFIV